MSSYQTTKEETEVTDLMGKHFDGLLKMMIRRRI